MGKLFCPWETFAFCSNGEKSPQQGRLPHAEERCVDVSIVQN